MTRYVPARVPLLDPRTGLVSREWYLFFQTMMDPSAGGEDDAALLLGGALAASLTDAPDDILDLAPYLISEIPDDLAPRTEYRELEDDLSPPSYLSGGTVSSVGVVPANGVSANIVDPTGDARLTFSLGDIQPTSIDTGGEARCGSLRIQQSPTTGTITPTAYFTVSLGGTNYRVPCAV